MAFTSDTLPCRDWHGWKPALAPSCGYGAPVIALYSRRLGCLGSIVLSVMLTGLLILLFVLL
jgi:hypothetical protein